MAKRPRKLSPNRIERSRFSIHPSSGVSFLFVPHPTPTAPLSRSLGSSLIVGTIEPRELELYRVLGRACRRRCCFQFSPRFAPAHLCHPLSGIHGAAAFG